MVTQPWDRAVDDEEWRTWVGAVPFGQLVVNNRDPRFAPIVVAAHAVLEGGALLMHLARLNPIWPHIEAGGAVKFAVVGDHAYVPSGWRADPGASERDGVPTSYYTSVQFTCRSQILDDPAANAALLTRQLAHLQPEGGHAEIAAGLPPYGRMLPGIRGLRLAIDNVEATFKYDGHKPADLRGRVAAELERRDRPGDAGAAAQQRRRSAQAQQAPDGLGS